MGAKLDGNVRSTSYVSANAPLFWIAIGYIGLFWLCWLAVLSSIILWF